MLARLRRVVLRNANEANSRSRTLGGDDASIRSTCHCEDTERGGTRIAARNAARYAASSSNRASGATTMFPIVTQHVKDTAAEAEGHDLDLRLLFVASFRLQHRVMSSSKVLVLGAANGKLKALFSKLASINAKSGPFTFAVLLGDLFGEGEELDELLAGKIKVPIECFATVGQKAVPELVRQRIEERHGEVCENLVFIGTYDACSERGRHASQRRARPNYRAGSVDASRRTASVVDDGFLI